MKLYTLDNKFIEETNRIPLNFTGIAEPNNGLKEWYFDGRRHRLDGPACEWSNGTKEWRVDGKLHRLDGPAIEYADGRKYWNVGGKRHRLDGPACEHADGDKEWYVDDKSVSEEQCKLLYSMMKLKGLI